MTQPLHVALVSSIWTLAGDPENAITHPNGAVCWTIFPGLDGPAGVVLTIEGAPVPAWCIAHITGGSVRLLYAARLDSIPGPVHPHSAGIATNIQTGYAFSIISGAVHAWLKSGDLGGRVEPTEP